MLLAFVVLIMIIVYFLIFKKETFVKYDQKLLFGLDKSKDKLYQVNLRLSQLKHLEKTHKILNENRNETKQVNVNNNDKGDSDGTKN